MIELASGLLAIAGLFAERAVRIARSDRVSARLGLVRHDRSAPRLPWKLAWGVPILLVVGATAGPVPAVVGAACIVLIPPALRRRRRATERRRSAEQIADAVSAMSAGLRAGLSLPQSFAYARDEADEPLRTDLADLVDKIAVGTPVGEALAEWSDAQASEDVYLIVGVLDLHRRSGGDLPTVLDGLATTLRERRAAHRDVRALTAQARLSGVILGMLPIGFFGFLMLTSRREMLEAIGTPLGGTALAIGLGLELLAFLWIRHLLEVR
jgi:tight adherence protein B